MRSSGNIGLYRIGEFGTVIVAGCRVLSVTNSNLLKCSQRKAQEISPVPAKWVECSRTQCKAVIKFDQFRASELLLKAAFRRKAA